MAKHEKECFYNPESKSCATCKFLDCIPFLDILNRIATDDEAEIITCSVKGTFHMEDSTPYGEEANYNIFHSVLNDEYKYLKDYTMKQYCKSFKTVLRKLTTNCNHHKTK